MLVVDLFSGTGAATQAFADRGHKVIRIDNNPKLKPDIVADVCFLPLKDLKPDFVWASPPCQDFSNVCHRNWTRQREGGWPAEGFETYLAACDAIAILNPPYWAIENVRGAARWWGKPTKRVGRSTCKANAPFLLWGRFPPFDANTPFKGFVRFNKTSPAHHTPPAATSASIPYALSLALCMALERDLA